MKSYTDLEQSKMLSGILPIETADMCYRIVAYNPNNTHVYQPYCFVKTLESDIPCWSLAALLEAIRGKVGYDLSIWDEGYNIDVYDLESGKAITELYSNPVDAAVETIYNLKERNLL